MSSTDKKQENTPLLSPVKKSWSTSIDLKRLFQVRFGVVVISILSLLAGVAVYVIRSQRGYLIDHSSSTDYPSTYEKQSFDVIVIGGGPAGSVIARRFSDHTHLNVLLLEAGNASQSIFQGKDFVHDSILTRFDVPLYWPNVASIPEYHWDIEGALVAKVLGGCGSHNAMLYVRALPNDIEGWNLPGWTWKEAFQTYVSLENYTGPASNFHGTSGRVQTSPPYHVGELSEKFLRSCIQAGIPFTEDFNAPHGRHGVGYYHFNIRNGVRDSAAKVFLGDVFNTRKNLHIRLNSVVENIEMNSNGKAMGVHLHGGNFIRLKPHGQVILTAGALNTPRLLTFSGIGAQNTLADLGIPMVQHLPGVGSNLQDHPVVALKFRSSEPDKMSYRGDFQKYLKAIQTGQVTDFGVYASPGLSVGAFLVPPNASHPEIQLTFFPQNSEPHVNNNSRIGHIDDEILVTVALLTPVARNRLLFSRSQAKATTKAEGTSRSTKMHKKTNSFQYQTEIVPEVPEKNQEHLTAVDLAKLVWGVRRVRQICAQAEMQAVLDEEMVPGVHVTTDAEIEAWILRSDLRNSHWVGTAKMGPRDEGGVVDSTNFRVHGTQNLYVADASVIPTIPNGNVHSTVIMIASKAAEKIYEERARLHPILPTDEERRA